MNNAHDRLRGTTDGGADPDPIDGALWTIGAHRPFDRVANQGSGRWCLRGTEPVRIVR